MTSNIPAKIISREVMLLLASWLITSIWGSLANALSLPPDSSVTDMFFSHLGGDYGNNWRLVQYRYFPLREFISFLFQ